MYWVSILGSQGRILQPCPTQRLELKTVQLAVITGRCCQPELDGQGELSEVSQPDLASPALRPELVGLGVLQLSHPLVPVQLQQVLPPRRTSSGPFRGISYSGVQPSNNRYHSFEIGFFPAGNKQSNWCQFDVATYLQRNFDIPFT